MTNFVSALKVGRDGASRMLISSSLFAFACVPLMFVFWVTDSAEDRAYDWTAYLACSGIFVTIGAFGLTLGLLQWRGVLAGFPRVQAWAKCSIAFVVALTTVFLIWAIYVFIRSDPFVW